MKATFVLCICSLLDVSAFLILNSFGGIYYRTFPQQLQEPITPSVSRRYAEFANSGRLIRDSDFEQRRDLDAILLERAARFHASDGPTKAANREKCIVVAVDRTLQASQDVDAFSTVESLTELSELCGTAGLEVIGSCVQRLSLPNPRTYMGVGKLHELLELCRSTGVYTVVIDDDLSARQQRNIERLLSMRESPIDPTVVMDTDDQGSGYADSDSRDFDATDEATFDSFGGRSTKDISAARLQAGNIPKTDISSAELTEENAREALLLELSLPPEKSKKQIEKEQKKMEKKQRKKAKSSSAFQFIEATDAGNNDDIYNSPGDPEISVKVLDRTAIILDIFAQHAKSREGQLQVCNYLACITMAFTVLISLYP